MQGQISHKTVRWHLYRMADQVFKNTQLRVDVFLIVLLSIIYNP